MEKRLLPVVAFALLFAVSAPQRAPAEDPAIVLTPSEWDFGTIAAGSRAFLTLQVENRGSSQVTISVLPTCDCLSTGPSRRVIPAGSRAEFRFSILAEDDESGPVSETYLIQTDLVGLDHFSYSVHGTVKH